MLLLIAIWVVTVGCAAKPSNTYVFGDVLLREDFSDPSAWEWYVNPDQHVDFRVTNDVYLARAWDHALMWVLNETLHDNVVIEVETTQDSDFRDNAYGLMCRASPTDNGNGYYFLISGDGQYTIRRGAGDEIKPLIQWHASGAIHQDKAINRIRIVCIGDYLALYVNDVFVDETHDRRYLSGYAGLSAAVVDNGDVEVEFDHLTIWSATLRSG